MFFSIVFIIPPNVPLKNKIDRRGAVYFVQKGYFGFEIMRLSGGITTILLYKIFAKNASVSVKKM